MISIIVEIIFTFRQLIARRKRKISVKTFPSFSKLYFKYVCKLLPGGLSPGKVTSGHIFSRSHRNGFVPHYRFIFWASRNHFRQKDWFTFSVLFCTKRTQDFLFPVCAKRYERRELCSNFRNHFSKKVIMKKIMRSSI